MTTTARTGLQLRSTVKKEGLLELSLVDVPIPEPKPDEVVVRVEASPINPSDLGLLFGGADMSTAKASGTPERPVVTAEIRPEMLRGMAGRIDQPMPVGNEGAGVVLSAGSSPAAQALLGKTVAILGGAMYAQYRTIKAAQCLLLPEGTTPADGASCFVNPLTAIGMVETMRREGHKALVHTAAASNLGQMLVKLCHEDGIGLVNIVRKPEQLALLKSIGATHICNMTAPTFMDDLTNALVETGATLAFDAIGGGRQAGQILACMEMRRQQDGQRIQPLRVDDPQAGLHLRRARPWTDGAQSRVRHGVGYRRLAPDVVPCRRSDPRRHRSCANVSRERSRRPSRADTRRRSRWPKRCSRKRSRCTASRQPARSTSSTRTRVSAEGTFHVLPEDDLARSGRRARSVPQRARSGEGVCDGPEYLVPYSASGRPLHLLPRSRAERRTDHSAASRTSVVVAHVRAAAHAAGGPVSHGRSRLSGLRAQRRAHTKGVRVHLRQHRPGDGSLHRDVEPDEVHPLHAGLRRTRSASGWRSLTRIASTP